MHKYATLGDTLYFWFALNATTGGGGDGASPAFDVRLGGASASAAPVLSGTPDLLSHANYPDGAYEVAIVATSGNGFAANGQYGVFCTAAISSVNPTGFIGGFTLAPVVANITQIGGDGQSATDLKDFVDAGYDPTTHKVEEVKVLTGHTAQTGDSYTRLGAPAGASIAADIATRSSSTEVQAIQNNTRVVRVVPPVIERPDAGSQVYRIELLAYDTLGNMEAPDAAPTIGVVNQAGTSRNSRLDSTTMTLISAGRYRAEYTASDTDDLEQLVFEFSITEGGNARVYANGSVVVDTTAVDFTSADRAKLTQLAADYTTSRASNLDNLDAAVSDTATQTSVDDLQTAIDAANDILNKFDTMVELDTSVWRFTTNALEQGPAGGGGGGGTDWTNDEKDAFRKILGIPASGSTPLMPTEGVLFLMSGATFNTSTDSLESLRNRGDAAWLTATGFATPGDLSSVGSAIVSATAAAITSDHGSGSYVRNTEPDNAGILAAIAALNNLSSSAVETAVSTALAGYSVATTSSIPAPSAIVTELFGTATEGSETFLQALRLLRAAMVGKVSVSGATVSFRDAADSKNRIVSTVDSNGQRTAVTADGT